MIVIAKKKGETTDNLFRKFSKLFREEDVVFEVNRKLFFKKPSLLKKEKERERMKRRAEKKVGAKRFYGQNFFRSKI